MASYNKFNSFTLELVNGTHDFDGGVFKIALTNTAPTSTMSQSSALSEIAAGNGYSAGGTATTITTQTSTGEAKVVGTDVLFTASGGAIANFRYAYFYQNTSSNALGPVIGWWDSGATQTITDGNSFLVDFSTGTGVFTVL